MGIQYRYPRPSNALPDETYFKWRELGLELLRAGGSVRGLIPLLGLSSEQYESFMDTLHWRNTAFRYPKPDEPIRIPETSPTCYVSFFRALNLKVPGEATGDRHFHISFFGYTDGEVAELAGEGTEVDTTPSLGTLGVREMGHLIAKRGIKPYDGPVYVANHYRAIADLVAENLLNMPLDDLLEDPVYFLFPAGRINEYLNSQEQVDRLTAEYLRPFRSQLPASRQAAFDTWVPTLVFKI